MNHKAPVINDFHFIVKELRIAEIRRVLQDCQKFTKTLIIRRIPTTILKRATMEEIISKYLGNIEENYKINCLTITAPFYSSKKLDIVCKYYDHKIRRIYLYSKCHSTKKKK